MEFDELQIRFRSRALDLSESEIEQYSAIGYVLSEISRLEYAMDQLAFKLAEIEPKFCKSLSRKFPQQISDKLTFSISAFRKHSKLSKIGDAESALSFDRLSADLDYVFGFRNIIAHGANHFSSTENGKSEYSFTKFTRQKRQNGVRSDTFRQETFIITTEMIEYILLLKSSLTPVFTAALRVLDGVDIWAEAKELETGRIEFCQRLKKLQSEGVMIDDPLGLLDGFGYD